MKTIILYILWASAWFAGMSGPGKQLASDRKPDSAEQKVYRCTNGRVQFKSDAPLEIIEAQSKHLRGVVDAEKQSFAWSVEMRSFEGFNGPLQREHFNENYLESDRYTDATFLGKIIERVDFSHDGLYTIRAKGKLSIHGIEQERIIKGTLEVKGKKLRVEASFSIPLTDHNITIPKIVHQKIAEEILVTVNADLILID